MILRKRNQSTEQTNTQENKKARLSNSFIVQQDLKRNSTFSDISDENNSQENDESGKENNLLETQNDAAHGGEPNTSNAKVVDVSVSCLF